VAQPSRDDFCGQTGPPGRAGQLPHATPAPPPRRTAPRPGGSNAQIATSAVGLISITTGGNLIWSLVAIVVGILIGTLFMATHSTQGPQLGLPQMIQSRPQFGYIGALLVWLFAYAQYAGFNVFNTILAGEAVATTGHVGSAKVWFWIVTIVAALIALFGYDLIHSFERYLTYVTVAMLVLLTIAVLTQLTMPAGSYDLGAFHIVPFLGELGVCAGYQISWAIHVSDYSRYLQGTLRIEPAPLGKSHDVDFPRSSGRTVHVITAYNPAGQVVADETNTVAHERLTARLQGMGVNYCPAAGGDIQ